MILNELSSLPLFNSDLNGFKCRTEGFSADKLGSLVKNYLQKAL